MRECARACVRVCMCVCMCSSVNAMRRSQAMSASTHAYAHAPFAASFHSIGESERNIFGGIMPSDPSVTKSSCLSLPLRSMPKLEESN